MKINHLLVALLLLGGCSKSSDVPPTLGTSTTIVSLTNPAKTFDATGQKLVLQGAFADGAHTTSGSVKLYESGSTRTLVFNDFKTDAGPDLHIWLAETKQAQNYVEVSAKLATGNFFLELPATADPTKQMQVLIWCKQYAVLFGSAKLN